jgi:hypothetical protein
MKKVGKSWIHSFLILICLREISSQSIFFDLGACCHRCWIKEAFKLQIAPVAIECAKIVKEGMSNTTIPTPDFTNLTGYFHTLKEFQQLSETCVLSCMFLKLGLVTPDNNIWNIAENLKPFARRFYMEGSWELQYADRWIDECVYAETNMNPPITLPNGLKCSHRQTNFNRCIWRKRFENCPCPLRDFSGICLLLRLNLTRFDQNFLVV